MIARIVAFALRQRFITLATVLVLTAAGIVSFSRLPIDYEHLVGQPQLQIVVDRKAAARYGINVQDVQDAIEASTRGRVVSEVFEGERRFNLAVRLAQDGEPLAGLRNLTISAPGGERIPLAPTGRVRHYALRRERA